MQCCLYFYQRCSVLAYQLPPGSSCVQCTATCVPPIKLENQFLCRYRLKTNIHWFTNGKPKVTSRTTGTTVMTSSLCCIVHLQLLKGGKWLKESLRLNNSKFMLYNITMLYNYYTWIYYYTCNINLLLYMAMFCYSRHVTAYAEILQVS